MCEIRPQPKTIPQIVAIAKSGRKIEAIKEFRVAFGCGLKEGKDAIEGIMHMLAVERGEAACDSIIDEFGGNYMVVTRSAGELSWKGRSPILTREQALADADLLVNSYEETVVAKVIAKSVPITTRSMKIV